MLIEIIKQTWVVLVALAQIIITSLAVAVIAGTIIFHKRSKKYIVVDFDCLVNIEPIKQRAKIWYDNHPEDLHDPLKFMVAHISEQTIDSKFILKCRQWQGMGYKMIYFSNRHERLRVATAKVLNDWQLSGVLYCCGNQYYKEHEMREFVKTHNVAGCITDHSKEGSKHLASVILGVKAI